MKYAVHLLLSVALIGHFPFLLAAEVALRDVRSNFRPGTAGAVVVEQGALVHTALMLPVDEKNRIVSPETRAQAEATLDHIAKILKEAATDLDHLVRLHVYAVNADVVGEVEKLLEERFSGTRQPAVTFVETTMPRDGVQVMLDAIAAVSSSGSRDPKLLTVDGLPLSQPRASHAAIQPEGPWVSISGRAAPGEFGDAIRDTMEQLRQDLAGMGLGLEDAVQIKSFLRDMPRMQEAEKIIGEFFPDGKVPPLVFTEWRQTSFPAEIELIAAAHQEPGKDYNRLEFSEAMSRFSRLVRVNGGRPIFTSGLYGPSDDPREQVGEIFSTLQELLEASGSDMRHLVKATYYISGNEANSEINRIRPTLYDPQRAPAASKLTVGGTGRHGKGSTLDMIAITTDDQP